MDDESGPLFYLGFGPLAAILLGFALVPLRGWTTASNFTFVFLALTIMVAEFGGRGAAVATALCSALSLDYFLTEPYLRLEITDKHDVIAFAGLAACGLIAATFGSRHGKRIDQPEGERDGIDVIRSIIREWNSEAPLGPQLAGVLKATLDAFPLSGAVIRDERNAVVVSSAPGDRQRPIPVAELAPDTLLPPGASAREFLGRVLPAPIQAGRVAIVSGGRTLGWLDVWGNGAHASSESRRALSDVARLLAILLAGGSRHERPRE